MMSIDLSDLTPMPRRAAGQAPKRPTPCAGLFGWRKDAKPSPGEGTASKDADPAPGRDYPAG